VVANILTRRPTPLFAATVGLTLLCLVSVRVDRLFAQTSPEDFQHDQSEGENLTTEEEPAYGEEFRAEELEEEQLTTEGEEEEEDLEQETAPVLPKDFSAPDSLHFPERLPEEEFDTPLGETVPDDEPSEDELKEFGTPPAEAVPNDEPSDDEPVEEPPPMSSALPTLPEASTLPPHERLAVHFVESGVEALSRDDFEQAQEHFEQALEIAPMQPFGYYFLGRLAFARGEHKTALVFLRKADAGLVHRDQTWRGEAARLRGAVYEDMRDYRRAHAAYRQSLQLTPMNLRAASALARLADEESDPRAVFPR
jgi:tetratricopeptide (TPR) repeat protein